MVTAWRHGKGAEEIPLGSVDRLIDSYVRTATGMMDGIEGICRPSRIGLPGGIHRILIRG